MNGTLNVKAITRTWDALQKIVPLAPIRADAEYDQMVELMDLLLNEIAGDETHSLMGLLDIVSGFVGTYDDKHHTLATAQLHEVLSFLMDQRQLKQTDLKHLVPQSNLSAILNGKRGISAELAGKLASFFNVSAAVFIPGF